MNNEDVLEIVMNSRRLVKETRLEFKRYLAAEIAWEDPLICIKGARGTGKTTLMLQRLKEEFGENSDKAIYLSLDDLWFSRFSAREAIEFFYNHGFTHVFLDEIHHYGRDWQTFIKNIADSFPSMHFVYSGSSMLKIDKAKGDLSRRQAVYQLKGMSFREYLEFEGVKKLPVMPLEEIVTRHLELEAQVTAGEVKILPLFEKYLESGFYPFYKRARGQYRERLKETVNTVLEGDYPAIDDVSQDTIRKAKRMLMVLAASAPQTPTMSALYRELETDRVQGMKMLMALDSAGLLALVPGKGATLKNLSKPEKIYCDNTNLMHALVRNVNVGVRRETYFFNQMRKDHDVEFTGVGDFVVDGKWTFEVGGPGKGFDQIKDVPNSFVVNDGVESGFDNKIPIWLFGMMY